MMTLRYRFTLGACLIALTSCGGTRDFIREKYTGERYGDPVTGVRRPPVLNPAAQVKPPAKIVPTAQGPKTAPASPATPYEQFDAQGNDTSRTNYVKQWFGDKPAEAAPRKPFRGLASAGQPTPPLVVAPIVPTAKSEPEIVPQTHITPQADDGMVPPPPSVAEENGVMVDIPEERVERSESPEAAFAQLAPAAGKPVPDVYPHLSDVPKMPPQIRVIRKSRESDEVELKMNHDAAMEQQKLIKEEPTELLPTTLPQVEGMIQEIDDAVHGDEPIVQAQAAQ